MVGAVVLMAEEKKPKTWGREAASALMLVYIAGVVWTMSEAEPDQKIDILSFNAPFVFAMVAAAWGVKNAREYWKP